MILENPTKGSDDNNGQRNSGRLNSPNADLEGAFNVNSNGSRGGQYPPF